MWRGAVGLGIVLCGMLWAFSRADAGQVYVVRAGDTLWHISHQLGVRPADLASTNHLVLTGTIHPGLRLLVPGAAPATAEPVTPRLSLRDPEHAATGSPPLKTPSSLAVSRVSSFSSAAVRIATGLLGKPYQWAGVGSHGFDCSGLVAHVFAALGRRLPHSSFAQYETGTLVSRWDLAPGDLVFFRTYNAGASHVGIYIGDGRFIHASYSRGVVISSIEESYYRDRFLGGRRI
jgi:cell wall-associated NlpC family hydrolase